MTYERILYVTSNTQESIHEIENIKNCNLDHTDLKIFHGLQ